MTATARRIGTAADDEGNSFWMLVNPTTQFFVDPFCTARNFSLGFSSGA